MIQLRFTTTKPLFFGGVFASAEESEPLVYPANIGSLIQKKVKGDHAYIHDDAEQLAGFDIPMFIDGDFSQLDQPEAVQDILMLLPSGEYKCVAEVINNGYYLTLKK